MDEEISGRYEALDGLRGILAYGVFFQHAIQNYVFYQTGIWQITDSRFYRFLGGEAVILFFMITSFLYWTKAINKNGKMDMYSTYKNRVFRLAPMYLFSAGVITVFALLETGFNVSQPIQLIKDSVSWLSLGIITTLSVNGTSIIPINAGIHWTLRFEWIFYIVLPFAAIVLRNKRMHVLAIPIMTILFLMPDKGYWVIFLFGIMGAHVVNKFPKQPWLLKPIMTILPLIGLIAVYLIDYKPYGMVQYGISFLVFLSFVYGNDMWGLLRSRPAKFLGTISYSVYLLHGIVLYIVLKLVDIFYPVISLSLVVYWTLMLVASLLVLLFSTVTYRYVEYPFLRKSPKRPQETIVTLTDKVM